MSSPIVFYIFNGAGLILSLAALVVVVNALSKISGMMNGGPSVQVFLQGYLGFLDSAELLLSSPLDSKLLVGSGRLEAKENLSAIVSDKMAKLRKEWQVYFTTAKQEIDRAVPDFTTPALYQLYRKRFPN